MQSISDTSSRNASESVAPTSLQSGKACSFQRGFLQVYVRTVAVLQTQSMNAARSSAMPLMRQPVKRQFRNVSLGKSPSVSVRFSNRTNSTSVSLRRLRKQRREIGARGVLQLWRVVFHINTEYSTYGNARTTNKKTTPEECMLEKPNTGESLCSFVRQYVIMVSKLTYEHHDVTRSSALCW